jgi:hypothetical protein
MIAKWDNICGVLTGNAPRMPRLTDGIKGRFKLKYFRKGFSERVAEKYSGESLEREDKELF